ncbi:MAG: KpsF/GutQ family sugar-phosphate isomerase [Chitinophagaceae bacterium]|jgi:arabinose-5-phosphate isomerase|nr:KpsF/GutQ family sugar-phosphate isomerase [Chitinophagaceae bacterium]
MASVNPKDIALRTIQLEADSIQQLATQLSDEFNTIVDTIMNAKGRLIVSGIGKSAIIAQKIVATLNSTGTPAVYLHAAEAIHGDLGMILNYDVVMIISKSGESPEIRVLSQLIKNFGNTIIGMVGNVDSYLAKQSDYVLNTTVSQEACPNNLAPTSSTTAQMVMGDALAVALMEKRGFSSSDFAKFHPGGALGKKLYLRVNDLSVHNEQPKVVADALLKDVIIEISKKRLGVTAVVNETNELLGVITDGDLRRMLEKTTAIDSIKASEIMSTHPKTIEGDALAIDAMELMRNHNISQLLVTEGKQYAGVIHLHDLIKEGLI